MSWGFGAAPSAAASDSSKATGAPDLEEIQTDVSS